MTASTLIIAERRAPHTTRDQMSRPNLSVPK
jgi:hypothetical protein